MEFPVKEKEYREALIDDDICPECGGDLDTGWECTNYKTCGFDSENERYRKEPKA